MDIKSSIKHILTCLTAITMLLLSGCGYVSDKPLNNIDVYKADQLQACKIDIDKLGEIFKENQEDQIKCLQENFIQYTKYVKTSSTDSVNQNELSDFVKKIFKGQSDSIVKGLSIIFQLNMILLKDEAQKISKGNIGPLFNLLITANREAIIITNTIQDMGKPENQERFFEIRNVFKKSVERFSQATLKIMTTKTSFNDQSLNIKKFIIDASKKIGNKEIDEEFIDSIIGLKPILVGGSREIITTSELSKFIENLPKLLVLSFDVYYSDKTNFKRESIQSKFYMDDLKTLRDLINFNQDNSPLFTVDQLLNLTKNVMSSSKVDFFKFKPSVIALKKKIIGGANNSFNIQDIKTIIDIVVEVSEKMYFDNVTYEVRSAILDSNAPITYQDLSPIYPSEYNNLQYAKVIEYTKNFNQLAVDFRYHRKNADSLPFYGLDYKRSKYGLVETSLFRFAAQKLLRAYGHLESKEYQVSLLEFQVFLVDMKPILEEIKLWSPNFESFARNAVLLADLFQNQSNGDGNVSEREATEYIQMVLSATLASNDFRSKLVNHCDPGINKEDALFEVKCLNEFFYNTFLNETKHRDYFPRLNEYVNTVSEDESINYLKGIEGFARDINDPNIPINKRDTILSIGAMINVETTFLRFDTNKDNVIDYNELVNSFKIYRSAIISLAGLKKGQEEYALSIYLYMVSKMEIPPTNDWLDNIKFYSFHKCVTKTYCRNTMLDPIEAKRLNIGSLLYYLVVQAERQKPTP